MARMGLILLFGLAIVSLVAGDKNETLMYTEIIELLRDNSDPDVIPITKDNPKPVEVRLEVSLLYVGKIDETADVLELVITQRHTFKHPALVWDSSSPDLKFENVTVPFRYIWSPDIIVSNIVSSPDIVTPELAIVSSDGEVLYEPQVTLRVHADLRGLHTPTGANITLNFESWTYDKSQLTIATPKDSCFKIDEFDSQHYKVSNPTITTTTKYVFSRSYDLHVFSFILQKK